MDSCVLIQNPSILHDLSLLRHRLLSSSHAWLTTTVRVGEEARTLYLARFRPPSLNHREPVQSMRSVTTDCVPSIVCTHTHEARLCVHTCTCTCVHMSRHAYMATPEYRELSRAIGRGITENSMAANSGLCALVYGCTFIEHRRPVYMSQTRDILVTYYCFVSLSPYHRSPHLVFVFLFI